MSGTQTTGYPNFFVKDKTDPKIQFARTLKRLEAIQNQLKSKPRGKKLAGKVCVITGAGSKRGIGRSSALAYAHEGAAHLYLLDFVADDLPDLQQTLKDDYPDVKVTVVQGDAADDKTISDLCQQAVNEEGRLDVFFANAGVATASSIPDTTNDQWMKIMRINTLSCFLAVKYAAEAMKKTSHTKPESGGSIIMTASVAGIRSGAGDVAYSASKAAVNNLAHTAAYQLTGSNIRVNSLCPGLIQTGMTSGIFDFAAARGSLGKVGQLVPLKRYGVPEEMAQVALFLASDDSSFVNGQNIAADGGLTASLPFAGIGRQGS